MSRARPTVTYAAERHPWCSAAQAIAGRKISWPVALAAEKTPMTRPRWVWNHRLATMAPKTRAMAPVPMPMTKPQSSQSCHGAVMKVVARLASPTRSRDSVTTRRGPKRSITAAAKGAARP